MKKHLAFFLAVVLLAVTLALPVGAAGEEDFPALQAQAVYVVNLDTGLVACAQNAEQPLGAASLTKLMTMLLLLKNYQDQLDTISVTAPSYIYDLIWQKTTNASTADIRRGETHTLRSLLYAMEVQSGNEAAYIAADYLGGGSIDNFVAMMNAEAAALGCTGTTFTDPCGLDEGNVTTARDVYLMLRALTEYDAYLQAAQATRYQMPASTQHSGPYTLVTTVKLIDSASVYYREYCRGGKTGSLGEWQNFAGLHTKNGESYISVVLNTPIGDEDPRPALTETALLMDWTFATYTIAAALDVTSPITEIPVVYATQADSVMLYPADNLMTLLPREGGASQAQATFTVPDRLTAPVKQGDVVGYVTLSLDGRVIGSADLLAGSTIDRNQVLYTLVRIGEFFQSTYFKVVVILTMIVVAVYSFLFVLAALGIFPAQSKKRR
ncbi:MAG: D-alanyl-D-alanine carboxypeptidase family protein [Gemmiger sp.]